MSQSGAYSEGFRIIEFTHQQLERLYGMLKKEKQIMKTVKNLVSCLHQKWRPMFTCRKQNRVNELWKNERTRVVMSARMSRWASFWCKDDVITGTGSHVFLRGGNRWPVGKKGSRAHATGSHVIWNGKPLTSWKKGSWAQGEVNPLRKRGLKVQSPILEAGVTLGVKTTQNK